LLLCKIQTVLKVRKMEDFWNELTKAMKCLNKLFKLWTKRLKMKFSLESKVRMRSDSGSPTSLES
jgi:hypothetical protein